MNIDFVKVPGRGLVKEPAYSTDGAAGIDFFLPEKIYTSDGKCLGDRTFLTTRDLTLKLGIRVRLPGGTCLLMQPRSGLATREGVILGATVIDEDYRGEVHAHLIPTRMNGGPVELRGGDKIVQAILLPYFRANFTEVLHIPEAETQRGVGGLGSTGRR